MSAVLLLYTRKDCCLCEAMKEVIRRVGERRAFTLEEVDVDGSAELQERYGSEVPVLLIDGRKAFKYRVTTKELEKKLKSVARGFAD